MTAPKFWPAVADALTELNILARAQLGSRPPATPPATAPWPAWAPDPGAWVREAHRGTDPAHWIHGPTWHIAGACIVEFDSTIFSLKLLCGRDIRVQPEGYDADALAHGCRSATFDVNGDVVRGKLELDDKDCASCRRRLRAVQRGRSHVGFPLVVRPYGDLGGGEFTRRLYASLGPNTGLVPHHKVAQAEQRRMEKAAIGAAFRHVSRT